MPCECLEEGRAVRCKAVEGALIPSLHERERYCRTESNWASCPTFQLQEREHRRIMMEEYYALWTLPELPRLTPQLPRPKSPLSRAV